MGGTVLLLGQELTMDGAVRLFGRNPSLRRHPRVLLSGIQVLALCLYTFCTLWPAVTYVVALRLVEKQEQSNSLDWRTITFTQRHAALLLKYKVLVAQPPRPWGGRSPRKSS